MSLTNLTNLTICITTQGETNPPIVFQSQLIYRILNADNHARTFDTEVGMNIFNMLKIVFSFIFKKVLNNFFYLSTKKSSELAYKHDSGSKCLFSVQ
jgi:hypothetical protein